MELFYLICEKKWPENALISLLNGFDQKDKNLIKETFKIFNLIQNFQKLPQIVKKKKILKLKKSYLMKEIII